MSKGTIKKNQSVGKLIDIIEIMAEYGEPIRLNDLSEKLSMSPTTVYRFLVALVEKDYVKKDEDSSKYYLTLRLKYFADKIHSNYSLSKIVHPYLKKLAEVTGESASLVIMEDDMAVYIDKVDRPDRMVRGLQRIGKRAPLFCTGVGKVFLADMTYDQLNKVLQPYLPLQKLTKNTITDLDKIQDELNLVWKDGISYDNEECEIGAKCIAAPIRDYSGRVIAAISISGPTPRMNDENLLKLRNILIETSDEISKELGFIV